MSPLGPWTRGDVIDLLIFFLLLIWFSLDRCNVYLREYDGKPENEDREEAQHPRGQDD